LKKIFAKYQLSFAYPDATSMFQQQRPTEPTPYPEADIIAEDRAASCYAYDHAYTQPVPRTSIDRCADKNRLTRHREARALEHHDYENGRISVVDDQILK
jgi:hypothetical protein